MAKFFCRIRSLRLIENPDCKFLADFLRLKGVAPNRRAAKLLIAEVAAGFRRTLLERLAGESVIIAVDGGTIQRQPLLNFCVAGGGVVYFWRSFPVANMTADTIHERTKDVRDELLACGVFPIGVVSDNASAMVRMAANMASATRADGDSDDEPEQEVEAAALNSDSDSTSESDDEFQPQDLSKVFGEALGRFDGFFHHIRCWTHTLQLLFSDMRRQCRDVAQAFAITSDVLAKCSVRKVRSKLPKLPPRPCATRWNSLVRTVVWCVENVEAINAVSPRRISERDLQKLKIAAVLLVPVCWATDVSQSDGFTAERAPELLQTLKKNISYIGTVTIAPQVQRRLRSGAAILSHCIQEREKECFSNHFVDLLRFFDPELGDTEQTPSTVVENILAFWRLKNVGTDKGAVEEALVKFANRTAGDKNFWTSKKLMYPRVSQFVDEIRAALQTEACVERSFAAQTNVIRSAPRIHSKTCNDRLFISINASRIEREVPAKDSPKVGHDVVLCVAKGNIMTHLKWKELIFTFAGEEPGVDGRVTRAMQRHETAANIGVATRVSVAFRVDGVLKYFPGTIVGRVGPDNYKIVYDSNAEKVEVFKPLSADDDWKILGKE